MIPFESDNLKAYTLLLRIEIALRELLRISLESEFGPQWRKRLPGELLKQVKESQAEENRPQFNFVRLGPLYYLTFGELLTLLQQKTGRSVAERLGGDCILKQLENVFSPRNAVCHSRPVSSVGLKAIETLYAEMETALTADGMLRLVSKPDTGLAQDQAANGLILGLGQMLRALPDLPSALSIPEIFETATAQFWWADDKLAGFNRSRVEGAIALLIDEADCLGKNVPLLQMFRNIFQVVERCSLVLAGTEAVFPALSEVFSPIPRQFHRVDVKSFARWSDTMDLVRRPLPKDLYDAVLPELEVLQELHELCGGAPDEIRLYCHQMYRSVEDGSSARMNLSPQVFREVLREYRSNTPANVDAVLNAIERLPDKLLFESRWLSRRNLTLEENLRVSVLIRELKHDKSLSSGERAEVASEMTDGYRKLFEAGITEIDNCIRLAGAPLSAGFWKSFVEVERGKRWSWDDDSFAENLRQPIIRAIGKACNSVVHIETQLGDSALQALLALRAGKAVTDISESMGEMIFSALIARDENSTHAVDVTLQMDSPAGRQATQIRFFEKPESEMRQEHINAWLEAHQALLAGNEISVAVLAFTHWVLPTHEELHRLGRISEFPIPEVFGSNVMEQAVAKFAEGDIQGSGGRRAVPPRRQRDGKAVVAQCVAADSNTRRPV